MNPAYDEPTVLRPLEPAIRWVWRIKSAILWFLLFAGVVAYEITSLLGDDGILPFGALMIAVFVVGLTYVVVQPALRYKFWRFDLRSDELFLERGIFTRVRTIVPLRRIQHIDVSQDVLEREFDLGKLIVHTAGARSSEVELPGLRYGEAQQLRETLKQYIHEDAV